MNQIHLKFGLLEHRSPYNSHGSLAFGATAPRSRRDEPKSNPIASAVQARDHNTCQFCGFRSERYQLTVALDLCGRDLSKIVTACIFCEQVVYLEKAVAQRSGVLVWLPELSQAQLNRTATAIYVCRLMGGAPGSMARTILNIVMERRTEARDALGSDNPVDLVARLRATGGGPPTVDTPHGLRLFPLDRRIRVFDNLEFNEFPQIHAFWRSMGGPVPGEKAVAGLEPLLELFPQARV
jgi:intracellular multiplication protein IcmJ